MDFKKRHPTVVITALTHIGIQFVAAAVNSMLEFFRLTYLVDRQHRPALCSLASHLWSIERSRSWKDLLWVVLRAYTPSVFNLILNLVWLPPTTSFRLSLDPSHSHHCTTSVVVSFRRKSWHSSLSSALALPAWLHCCWITIWYPSCFLPLGIHPLMYFTTWYIPCSCPLAYTLS